LARPESVADWVTLMDPLEHDLVGSAQSLFGEGLWTRAADRIGARQALRPGEDLLWAFRNPEGFDERLGRCRQALETARGLPNRSLELESEYALTLVEAMRTLARLSTTLAAPDLDEPGKDEARKALAVFEGQVERLVSLMDEQTDRLQCEPKAFAQQMKEEHRERWQQRLLAIRAAVGQALQ
jgi:hypothetical protein